MNERVSIIIPAYNKAELTVKTVESVLAQTYPNIEIIVVDDGSKDNTQELLLPYQDRIRYVYKQNGGACSARNVGIKLAQGDFVGFLDCDDQYVKDKVALSVKYLKENPQAGLVHTAAYFIDQNENVVGEYSHPQSRKQGWVSQKLIMSNFICNSTPVIRKECFAKVGLFDESIFPPADWDMWLRISEHYKIGYIAQPLTKYRVTDNYTFNKLELAEKEEIYVVNKFFDRNTEYSRFFKSRALSNVYLRYSQCYFLKSNILRLKEELMRCLRQNPLNLKAIAVFLSFVFIPFWAKAFLKKKILRY